MAASTRLLTDTALLAECRIDHYRGPGPGGQKRNKTSNAVRIVHLPTGIMATATEDRSTALNHLNALRRLRLKLAAELREPVDLLVFEPPEWFIAVRVNRQIAANHRHAQHAAVGGLLLDLLEALAGNPAAVGINLSVSTSAVVKFLHGEPTLWTAANAIRSRHGLKSIEHR